MAHVILLAAAKIFNLAHLGFLELSYSGPWFETPYQRATGRALSNEK